MSRRCDLAAAALCAAVWAALWAGPAAAEPEAVFLDASEADLDNPHDIALSEDGVRLYVSDVGHGRVVILDALTLSELGRFGEGEQSGTHDIAIDGETAYVADTRNNRIAIYALEGNDSLLIGELSGGMRGPEGVALHPNGRVYVAGAWSGNVVAYDAGEVVAELGGLAAPHDIALDPDDNLWIADSGNDRMLLVSPGLEILRVLEGAPYDFKGPRYQDVGPDGTLVVADKNSHQVKVIAPDGRLVLTIGTGEPGEGPGRFRTPEGIALSDDRLYVADSGNDRIVTYRLALD